MGYARLAREEYAWARRSFDEALILDPEHEDALAGLGETLMKFGQQDAAVRCFRRTLERVLTTEEPALIEIPCGEMPSPWQFIDMPKVRG